MSSLERAWQHRGLRARLLLPVSWIYAGVLALRHLAYKTGLKQRGYVPLPVIVVGNLSVGGTGKTPLCHYLVRYFQQTGWKPAIVSRGYGGARRTSPHLLTDEDTSATAGDEPLMLYRQTGVPVCVCVDRAAAVRHVAATTDANMVFADDGLQHLAMPRVAEILVVDGTRGFGNRWLLPAGPLRDTLKRLNGISVVAIQVPTDPPLASDEQTSEENLTPVAANQLHPSLSPEYTNELIHQSLNNQFTLEPTHVISVADGRRRELSEFEGQTVHAVAGIGNPQRFFDSLQARGINLIPHPKGDHHNYLPDDLAFGDNLPVLVTSKDAVKLRDQVDSVARVFEVCVRIRASGTLDKAIRALDNELKACAEQGA